MGQALSVVAGAEGRRSRHRGRRRFDALELAYLGAAAQTVLFNPVVGAVGTLRVYANGLTWAIVGVAALVRCLLSRDPVLLGACRALIVACWVSITAIVFQVLVLGVQQYTIGSLVRLLYLPVGIVAALSVYRRIEDILDLVVGLVGLKCALLLATMARAPIDLANRLNPASLGGRNTFAAFLMALVVLRVSVWASTGRRPPWFVLGGLAMAMIAMVLTLTRSPVIGLVLGLATISLSALRRRGHLTGRSLRWGGAAAVLLSPVMAQGATRQRFSSLSLSESSGRNDIWSAASQSFADSPFVGHGFGSFDFTSRNIVEDYVTADKFGPPDPSIAHPTSSTHNIVWQLLAEGGVVGLAIVAWCAWYLTRRCWHPVVLPVLLALLADAMFQTIPYVVQTSWVLGLVFAVGLRFRHAEAVNPRSRRAQRVATTR